MLQRFRTRNSPSRWRFRPSSPVTFRFRVQPPGSTSTYSRSVLGAERTYPDGHGGSRGERSGKGRSLRRSAGENAVDSDQQLGREAGEELARVRARLVQRRDERGDARCHHDQVPRATAAGIPEGVGKAPRDEDRGSRGGLEAFVTADEPEAPLEDVPRLVVRQVPVQRRDGPVGGARAVVDPFGDHEVVAIEARAEQWRYFHPEMRPRLASTRIRPPRAERLVGPLPEGLWIVRHTSVTSFGVETRPVKAPAPSLSQLDITSIIVHVRGQAERLVSRCLQAATPCSR